LVVKWLETALVVDVDDVYVDIGTDGARSMCGKV
jgi:hypothetical protein